MMRRGVLVALALLVALGVAPPASRAQAAGATLTIISGQVQVQPPGAAGFSAGTDGQTLGVGVRIRTGADSRAVLTFFDGTTATLDPDTEVTVERIEPSGSGPGGLLVAVQLSAGRVWSQVTSLFDRGSSFEVRAAGTTAVSREGTFGYRLAQDGTLSCWAISGSPLVLSKNGEELMLRAGQQAVLPPDQKMPAAEARQFGPGVLEVQTEGAVLARLVNPDGLTVGFPLGDLVVNQVLDSTTSTPTAPSRWVRMPGPRPGHYSLVLQPEANGPYIVRVVLEVDGRELASNEWRGEARLGEVLVADLTVEVQDAKPVALRASEPRPLAGTPPGNFVYP